MPLTVTALARACGMSRTTVLYYEEMGLLKPSRRSGANYRIYDDRALRRLQEIRMYRRAGLTIGDIRSILDEPLSAAAGVLHRRLAEISNEIETLRDHQRAIARLFKQTDEIGSLPMVTKEKWIEVMRAAGFSDEDMRRWHAQFEKSAPQEHQEFLEFLHIPAEEVRSIRDRSRQAALQS